MFGSPSWFTRSYRWLLAAVLIWSLATRLYQLDQPKDYIFDEVYHAVTAKLIARNDVMAYEWWNPPIEPNTAVDWLHPPLAKYTQALGIKLLGETPLGWRLSSALTGVLVIALTAKLALILTKDHRLSLLAALLASWDGLLLTQSRLAMNDIHVTAAILGAVILYLQFRHHQPSDQLLPETAMAGRFWLAAGAMSGVALATKWSGLFVVGWIWLWELQRTWLWLAQQRRAELRRLCQWVGTGLMGLVVLPAMIYVSAYSHMFWQGKTLVCSGDELVQGQCYCSQESSWWVKSLSILIPTQSANFESWEARGGCKRLISHFSELHHQIWWYQTNLKATHGYQSRPWQWFLNLKPVWFHVKYLNPTAGQPAPVANIYALGNPILFWSGAGAVIWLGYWLIKQLSRSPQKLAPEWWSLAQLFTAYLIVWAPWQLSPRIMFFYHYTPAVPFITIILTVALMRLNQWSKLSAKTRQRLVTGWIILIGLVFVLWYPHWTELPVPAWWANRVYFAFPGWK